MPELSRQYPDLGGAPLRDRPVTSTDSRLCIRPCKYAGCRVLNSSRAIHRLGRNSRLEKRRSKWGLEILYTEGIENVQGVEASYRSKLRDAMRAMAVYTSTSARLTFWSPKQPWKPRLWFSLLYRFLCCHRLHKGPLVEKQMSSCMQIGACYPLRASTSEAFDSKTLETSRSTVATSRSNLVSRTNMEVVLLTDPPRAGIVDHA